MGKPKHARYKAAAVQFEPEFKNKEKNVEAQLTLAAEAARSGAKLIVLPEMGQTGYCYLNREELAPYVEPVPGPTTKKYAELARKHGAYIVVGLPEVDPKTHIYYNTAALVGPGGFVGKYRKVHSFIAEPRWAMDGNLGFPLFETEVGRLGMLICMDHAYFEGARVLALKGAEVLCFPTNWLGERTPAPAWITRSFENGVYSVCADRWGLERGVQFAGGSCIIDPDGSVQALRDSGDGVVYGEIDLGKVRARKLPDGAGHMLGDRRPEHYSRLVMNTYLWNPLKFFNLYAHRRLPKGLEFRLSAVQMKPRRLDAEANLERIAYWASKAAERGARLVVFPELALTGAVFSDKREAAELAETADEACRRLAPVSRETETIIVAGFVEKSGNKLFNTALVVSSDGLLGRYRKLHLNGRDRAWAEPGDLGLPTFDTPLGRLGILIGSDAFFPEPARCLAAEGADIVCAPAAVSGPAPWKSGGTSIPHPKPIPTEADPTHWHLWRVRAGENCVYVAFANQHGEEGGVRFMGYSGIFQPDLWAFPRSEAAASGDGDLALTLAVDTSNRGEEWPANPVRVKSLLRMRQTRWYAELVAPPLRGRGDGK